MSENQQDQSKFIQNNIEYYDSLVRDNEAVTNTLFLEITKNVSIAATVLISFSSPLLNENIQNSSDLQKYLLISSWIFFALSILFSLIQVFIEYQFFNSHTNSKYIAKNFLENLKTKQISEEKKKLVAEIYLDNVITLIEKKRSSPIGIVVQIFLFLTGFINFLIYLILTIFE